MTAGVFRLRQPWLGMWPSPGALCRGGQGRQRKMMQGEDERRGREQTEGQCQGRGSEKRKLREKAEMTRLPHREEYRGQGKLPLAPLCPPPPIFSPICAYSPTFSLAYPPKTICIPKRRSTPTSSPTILPWELGSGNLGKH